MMRYITAMSAALLLSGCGSMDSMNPIDWFGSEESSVKPAELVELTGSVPVRTLWSTSVGSGADDQRVKLVPYVVDNRIYAADSSGTVKALDAASGRTQWSVETELEISGGPGAGEGLVLIGTSNAELVALDSSSGAERWRTRVSSEVLSVPKVSRGMAVVHTIDGKLFGFDAASGKQTWIYDRTAPVLTLHGSSSPVISGNAAICGFANGKLVSVELETGNPIWEVSVTAPRGRSELERMVDIDGDPLVVDGIIYVATYQGDMAAVSQDTGVVLWRRKLSSYTGLSVDYRQLYVSDDNDFVWAVDPRNGSALWKNEKLKARRLSAPAVLDDYVVVGDYQGYLHWLSTEDGRLLGRTRVGEDPITTAPVVNNGVVYIYGDGGALAAVTGAAKP
ncbi:MAG: outer membrane protein assembly factor BamB [Candidatus Sedimenticola sp. 20ELBAFRAG]